MVLTAQLQTSGLTGLPTTDTQCQNTVEGGVAVSNVETTPLCTGADNYVDSHVYEHNKGAHQFIL